jgi:hypothetical protein
LRNGVDDGQGRNLQYGRHFTAKHKDRSMQIDFDLESLGFKTLEEYQEFHGLKPDGNLGPVTLRSLEAPRFCAYPDKMAIGGVNCRWNKRLITYGFKGVLPGVTQEDMRRAMQIAFDRWSAVCNLRAQHAGIGAQTADIIVETGRIDGASGTLAWSELPCSGTDRTLRQKYDNGEPWVLADDVPQYRIDLIRVMCHELGHAIGIEHIGSGNLMAPTYSTRINGPQAGDIREAVARYGPPTATPPPKPDVPTDPPPAEESIWVQIPKSWVVKGL